MVETFFPNHVFYIIQIYTTDTKGAASVHIPTSTPSTCPPCRFGGLECTQGLHRTHFENHPSSPALGRWDPFQISTLQGKNRTAKINTFCLTRPFPKWWGERNIERWGFQRLESTWLERALAPGMLNDSRARHLPTRVHISFLLEKKGRILTRTRTSPFFSSWSPVWCTDNIPRPCVLSWCLRRRQEGGMLPHEAISGQQGRRGLGSHSGPAHSPLATPFSN